MTRDSSRQLTVADFEAADVTAEEFSHEMHVYVAWLYLRDRPMNDALERYSSGLKRLTKKLGADQKYNETVTWFFVLTIAERMQCQGPSDWCKFKARNRALLQDAKSLLAKSYSGQRLTSALARRQFLLPDLTPAFADEQLMQHC